MELEEVAFLELQAGPELLVGNLEGVLSEELQPFQEAYLVAFLDVVAFQEELQVVRGVPLVSLEVAYPVVLYQEANPYRVEPFQEASLSEAFLVVGRETLPEVDQEAFLEAHHENLEMAYPEEGLEVGHLALPLEASHLEAFRGVFVRVELQEADLGQEVKMVVHLAEHPVVAPVLDLQVEPQEEDLALAEHLVGHLVGHLEVDLALELPEVEHRVGVLGLVELLVVHPVVDLGLVEIRAEVLVLVVLPVVLQEVDRVPVEPQAALLEEVLVLVELQAALLVEVHGLVEHREADPDPVELLVEDLLVVQTLEVGL